MKHTNTRALFRYWNELRAGRAAPYRSELDPRAISPLLESTFILEHPKAGAPRFRLAGTKLCDQFGMELRGMSALALWHGDCRARMKTLLSEVVSAPCIGHVLCTVETRSGRHFPAEFLYLPLRSDLGEMTRVVGCGLYMGEGEMGLDDHEPLHHWIEEINVYQIDSAEIAEGAAPGPVLSEAGPEIEAEEGPSDALKQAVTRLDARRKRPLRAPKRPRFKTIEGGRAQDSQASPLREELARLDERLKNAPRGHLKVIDGGGATASASERDGAA